MKELPSYQQLKENLPANLQQRAFIAKSREQIADILNGKDDRFLIIVGPCSIHDVNAAKDYAALLKELSTKLSSDFLIVMRTYCEKARSTSGWKGLLYDPFLDGSHNVEMGLQWTRQLLLDLATLELPTATEFLDPITAPYYEDLIAWGSIGARTSSSQPHRQLASGLTMPLGFKNGIAGNISSAIQGIATAASPHSYLGLNEQGALTIIHTRGNPNTHVVLRGGEMGPNYDAESVSETLQTLENHGLPSRIIIDCSHQNSRKVCHQQPQVFESILDQAIKNKAKICGAMIESYLVEGHQTYLRDQALQHGISITDACLGWQATEKLLIEGAKKWQLATKELNLNEALSS